MKVRRCGPTDAAHVVAHQVRHRSERGPAFIPSSIAAMAAVPAERNGIAAALLKAMTTGVR
jgi:hypothetical protein